MSVYITGCEKETEHVFHDSVLENRYDSTASTSNTLLENVNFDQNGNILVNSGEGQITIEHANIEFQREMSMFIFDYADSEYINNAQNEFGFPNWKLSTIDRIDSFSNYLISVPLFKNNELTSFILYYHSHENKYVDIITKSKIYSILAVNDDNLYFPDWLFPIIKYNQYQYIISGVQLEGLEQWLNKSTSTLEYRCVKCRCMPITPINITSDLLNSTYGLSMKGGGGGSGSSSGNSTGSGSGTGENGTDGEDKTSNKAKKLKELACMMAVEDFMALDEVQDMIDNNTLVDPCNPNKSIEDMITDAVSGKCKDGVLNLNTVNDLLKDLGKNGGGKMNKTESFRNCKALNCLFDELYNSGITNFCDLQNNFETDNKVIDLKVGNTSQFTKGRKAFTGVDSKTGRITIFFNPNLCVDDFKFDPSDFASDFLRTAKTIIHESVHADFWREVSNILPDGKTLTSINQSTFNETFQEFIDIVCTEGDVLTDQHEVMINSWIDKLSKDLWEYNGKVGNWEDYKYLAWLGLYPDEEHNECVEPLLSLQEYATLRDNYEQNIWNNSQTKLNEKKINDCLKNN